MSVLSCDKFAIENIDRDMLGEEKDLYEVKWWDYRTMHPTQATLHFYAVYKEILSEFISKYISNKDGDSYRRNSAKKDLRASKSLHTIRGFWKARQMADALGVPYPVYIRTMLTNFYDSFHKFKTTKTTKSNVPFTTHMVSDIVTERVMKDWEERKQAELHIPVNEAILNKSVWFRDAMEAQLREDAKLTMFPDSYIRKAIKTGAILGPA